MLTMSQLSNCGPELDHNIHVGKSQTVLSNLLRLVPYTLKYYNRRQNLLKFKVRSGMKISFLTLKIQQKVYRTCQISVTQELT
jgi:hypothetical protein